MIDCDLLKRLYREEKLSMNRIARQLGCSENRVVYWMNKHGIKRRTISDAIYTKHNPQGDPFEVRPIRTAEQAELLGLGLGLYWGEGTKADKYSVRLGNSDPELLKAFVRFLEELFAVDRTKLKFSLQIFTDIEPESALEYWTKQLNVKDSQFYKIHATISGSLGTYRQKSKYGVVTVYFHNKKLRDILVSMLPR